MSISLAFPRSYTLFGNESKQYNPLKLKQYHSSFQGVHLMKCTMRLMLLAVIGCLLSAPCLTAGEKKDKAAGKYKVRVVADLVYYKTKEADPDKHKLDLYLPKGKKDFPVLFFIHGGGWTRGSRKKFEKFGKTFASHGIGTVAISYRLTPQVQHPGHIEDVARAFSWTYRNISKYGGRNDQIFVSGHSAGGHLAALLGTDGHYLKAYRLSLANIKGDIPISGVYQLKPGRMARIFGKDPEKVRQAAPITHVSKNCPPFLILYAEKDGKGFDAMAQNFAKALKKKGVEATVREMQDRTHGTIVGNVPNPGDPTTVAMLEFIHRHLLGKTARKGSSGE